MVEMVMWEAPWGLWEVHQMREPDLDACHKEGANSQPSLARGAFNTPGT